jgi:hypothetical protein
LSTCFNGIGEIISYVSYLEAENNIKRYSNRPRALENWCLADYVSQLDIKYPKKKLEDTANFKDELL